MYLRENLHVRHSENAKESTAISAGVFVSCLCACVTSFIILIKKCSVLFL